MTLTHLIPQVGYGPILLLLYTHKNRFILLLSSFLWKGWQVPAAVWVQLFPT